MKEDKIIHLNLKGLLNYGMTVVIIMLSMQIGFVAIVCFNVDSVAVEIQKYY